jgi:tetratricopeptide (TPR) repeat protein
MKPFLRFVLLSCSLVVLSFSTPASGEESDKPLLPVPAEINAVLEGNDALKKNHMEFATGMLPDGSIVFELIAGNWRLREELEDEILSSAQLQADFMAAIDEEIPYQEARKVLRETVAEVLQRAGGRNLVVGGSVGTDADRRAEAEYGLGLKRYEAGKYQEAISYFERSAAANYPRAQRTIGFMYENGQGVKTDREEGRKWYQRAAGEGEGEALYNLGRMASSDKDYTEALAYYQKAIERSPDLSMAYNNIGYILNEMLHYQKAIPFLKKAIELNPDYSGSYSNMGISLDNLGRRDEAAGIYREALALNPTAADVRVNLGVTLMHQQKFDDAAREFFRAIHLKPQWHQPYSGLGSIYFEKKEFDLAVTAYQKLVKNRPNHPWGFKLLAESYAKLGDFDRAREAASTALDRARTIPEYDAKATEEIEQAYQEYLAAGASARS